MAYRLAAMTTRIMFSCYKVSDLVKNGVHLKTAEYLKSLHPSSAIEAFTDIDDTNTRPVTMFQKI